MSYKILSFGCLAAAFLLSTVAGTAMPARKTIITASDIEGNTIQAVQYGDENFHYYVSEDDGSLLIRKGDIFFPATLTDEGMLVESTAKVKANRVATRLNNIAKTQKRISGIVEGTTFPARGKQKVAVVLVEYQDVKFNLGNPHDYFSRMLNEENFSDYHATGSARDWFLQSSNGLFEPEFDVFGPFTLQQRREYYGGNNAYGQDNNPQRMVIEACRQLNANVDFTQYDRDGDGYIDNVFVVYAGRGEASGGGSDCVWPHAWKLSYAEPGTVYTFDGVRLDRYACSNEWELSDLGYGYRPVGIGSFVHEFSHVMGLPDLYPTDYVNDSFTAGAWSALDYGPYNNDGCTPPQYSAWERAALGYIDIPQLPATSANIALRPLEQGDAFIIPTENADEYFIIENRQQNGWDSFVPGHGMLLWHIDYDAQAWTSNTLNNDPAHNRVDIVEADGTMTNGSRAGDCFPGTDNVTAISAMTVPALKSWGGKDLGFALSDIRERHGNIILRVNGGSEDIATPESVKADNIHAGYFKVCWQPVAEATGYTVRVYDENFNEVCELEAPAEATELTVTGLKPSTAYTYTVCAEDGLFGSAPSIPQSVRTLDPTFDYFAPTVLPASDLTASSFTAKWEPMTDAKEYFITVYTQADGENLTYATGFDGGAEELPDGWTSTSKVTYGMAAYSGASIPSLRLSKDGDKLEIDCGSKRGISLSFWHRGNSTGANEAITVSYTADGEQQTLASIPVSAEKGGKTSNVELPDVPLQSLTLSFNRPEKGSLAIDDVVLTMHGDYIIEPHEAYNGINVGNVTSYAINNLEASQTYYYDVYANDGGEYTSLRSDRMKVDLSDLSGVSTAIAKPDIHIVGRTIECSAEIKIFDISGLLIASGCGNITVPSAGLYIITGACIKPTKIIITE